MELEKLSLDDLLNQMEYNDGVDIPVIRKEIHRRTGVVNLSNVVRQLPPPIENAQPEGGQLETLVRQQIAKDLIDCLPTTWLDPMLSGKDAVMGKNPWGCPDIEKLINAIRKKMKVVGNLPA